MPQYRIHGHLIESDITLPEPTVTAASAAELCIARGRDREIPILAPERVQLRYVSDNRIRYEGEVIDGGWAIQVPGLVRFETDGTSMIGFAAPAAPDGALELLLAGTALSFLFTVRGEFVLHASAVTFDDRCIAFVGESGQGKTTLATLASASGGEFFADDVLRLGFSSCITAYRGASEARLRKPASALGLSVDSPARTTIDDRTSIALQRAQRETARLAAVVVPRLWPDCDAVAVRRLASVDAFPLLLDAPRIVGWSEAAILTHEFEAITALISTVPVLEVDVPWGLPPAPSLAAEITGRVLEAIDGEGNPQAMTG